MVRRYTDSELKKALSDLVVLTDSREQVNGHILSWLDKKGIPHTERALETGDYSAQLGEYSFEDEVVVERKANLDEIARNLTAGRDRFEREFTRAKAHNTKVFLVVENASWSDIFLHNYRSRVKPEAFAATLLSWQVRFNLTITFCKSTETANIIHKTLYYWVRNRLKRG